MPAAGAQVPFVTYDCDDSLVCTCAGTVEKGSAHHRLAEEAINRRYAALKQTGDFLEFTAHAAANTLLLRYSLPFPSSRTVDYTLSVYINGSQAGDLSLSAFHIHMDRGLPENSFHPAAADLPESLVYRWWEECVIKDIDIRSGDVVRLQKDADNTAAAYYLDLIDLEQAGPPLGDNGSAPDTTWKTVTDFGVTPDDSSDNDQPGILACINAAIAGGHRKVWFPPGRYDIYEHIILNAAWQGLTIRGAGMWYTTINQIRSIMDPGFETSAHGVFWVNAPDVTFGDFKIDTRANFRRPAGTRNERGPAFKKDGDRLTLENLWVTHTSTFSWYAGTGGIFTNNRVRCTYADAYNLQSGATGCLVYNNHARGNGDDNLVHYCAAGVGTGNRIAYNTVESGYFGRGMMFSGTVRDTVEHNMITDHVEAGCLLGAFNLVTTPMESTLVRSNVITGSGGPAFNIRTQQNTAQAVIDGNWIVNPERECILIDPRYAVDLSLTDNVVVNLQADWMVNNNTADNTIVESGTVFLDVLPRDSTAAVNTERLITDRSYQRSRIYNLHGNPVGKCMAPGIYIRITDPGASPAVSKMMYLK